jgi:hypothetical protein
MLSKCLKQNKNFVYRNGGNIMKYYTIIFCLFLFSQLFSQDLLLKIATEKAKYFNGEPILVFCELENATNSTIEIMPISYYHIWYSLKPTLVLNDTTSLKIKCWAHYSPAGVGNAIPLEPGESISWFENVYDYFNTGGSKDVVSLTFLDIGEYKFKFYLDFWVKDPFKIIETISSNEVEFEIKEGKTLSELINKFSDVQKNRTSKDSFGENLKNLYLEYKGKEYDYFTGYRYAVFCGLSSQDKWKKELIDLCLKNPYSYWAVKYINQSDIAPIILEKLNNKGLDNTLAEKYSKQFLLYLNKIKRYTKLPIHD